MGDEMTQRQRNRVIAGWLLLCCAVIFSMMVLGAVTRLTGSGLSMVQWEPLMGIIPPLDQAEWEETFRLYQQYPEYKLKNLHMSLEEFKSIFWFEYSHRVLGRIIGILFLIPFLWFLFKGWLDRPLALRLAGMFVLGGLQGLMGWYMVKSGLVDNPRVSQYRLTAHLALAIIIYAYIFWVAMGLLRSKERIRVPAAVSGLRWMSLLITGFIFVTLLSGGFVAGTRAGFTFNTFPLMAGQFIPDAMYILEPFWKNWFENIVTVQFNHRLLATLLFFGILFFWWRASALPLPGVVRAGVHLLAIAVIVQVTLGISTLLLAVPVTLAAAHQAGGILLFTVSLYLNTWLFRGVESGKPVSRRDSPAGGFPRMAAQAAAETKGSE